MVAKQILKIDYFGKQIELDLERSRARRRTLSIIVKKDGRGIVRVPYRTPDSQIHSFVTEKTPWIVKTLQRVKTARPQAAQNENSFQHLGNVIDFEIVPSPLLKKGGFCERENDCFSVHVPAAMEHNLAYAKIIVNHWRRGEALKLLTSRADFYAAQLGVRYSAIKLAEQKTLWGSCDRFGVLRLNWHVIKCPAEVIDYLIVHELCHIVHANHSASYWKLVASIIPDYKIRRAELKRYENH